MTGINLDLFTVIVMLILAFICGYSSGHRLGREEVRKCIGGLIGAITNDLKKGDDMKHE